MHLSPRARHVSRRWDFTALTGIMATSRKRRVVSWFVAVSSAALLTVVFSAPTYAVHDTGKFQLDGDASSGTQPLPPYPQATDDWDKVCHQFSGAANADTLCSTTLNTS